jgi:hypothetical protein
VIAAFEPSWISIVVGVVILLISLIMFRSARRTQVKL